MLVVDDGSTDRTVGRRAQAAGADHLVRHRRNRGLAAAFRTGLDASLRLGADVIVNTDADNQYDGEDIPTLVRADPRRARRRRRRRPPDRRRLRHFSAGKRLLQRIGSARRAPAVRGPTCPTR